MKRAAVVIGMAFGDEGKGATVDALCRHLSADFVVRFNGGCQAAHHVVLTDGRYHKFSQFGSGSFCGVPTYIGPEVIIGPQWMNAEANHLVEQGVPDPFKLLHIDVRCLITTPWHVAYNRMKELSRGSGRHGSCGLGI